MLVGSISMQTPQKQQRQPFHFNLPEIAGEWSSYWRYLHMDLGRYFPQEYVKENIQSHYKLSSQL